MSSTGIWYKKSSTGKMVQWKAWAENGTYWVESGQVDGKKTTTAGVKCIGKQGRSNIEQAWFEMNAKLNKKKDSGYLADMEAAKTHVIMLPMLAHSFDKRKHNITYPCIVQRKFDGVRCFAMPDGRLLSRKGKEFPHLAHLRADQDGKMLQTVATFDGELYSDEMTFQELVGLVKRVTLKDGDEERMKLIKLRVYDCYLSSNPNLDFVNRTDWLSEAFRKDSSIPSGWEIVDNFTAYHEDDIYRLQRQFIEEGYEGAMVRNHQGEYALGKRSANLQKVKTFQDGEYKIVGFDEGVGKEAGCVIWECTTGVIGSNFVGFFKVRPKGTQAQRRDWFNNASQYIGKMLTVKYQELTDDGIPRFPVGISVRDYE
jgi:ATP-dependent DNA ligase